MSSELPPFRFALVLRYAAFALAPMAVVLFAADGLLYPTAEAVEPGWWATPLGKGLAAVIGLAAVPGAMAFLLTYEVLSATGLSEAVAVAVAGAVGSGVVGGALWWGGLVAVVVRWRRRRAALREPWDRRPPWRA